MKEIIDVYDENKQKTGKTILRGKERLQKGEYVLATKAIFVNSKKQILISKRSDAKPKNPGLWEIGAGGCSLTGETSLQAIIREIKEELGLDLNNKKGIFFKGYKDDHIFFDIWLYNIDVKISDLNFSDNEVVDAKWVEIDEYMNLHNQAMLANYKSFEYQDYDKCMKLLFKN